MLPLSNQQSNTSEMRRSNPFPQREGMVRWSMLTNKNITISINFKHDRTCSWNASRKHNSWQALHMYLWTETSAVITGLQKAPEVLKLEVFWQLTQDQKSPFLIMTQVIKTNVIQQTSVWFLYVALWSTTETRVLTGQDPAQSSLNDRTDMNQAFRNWPLSVEIWDLCSWQFFKFCHWPNAYYLSKQS